MTDEGSGSSFIPDPRRTAPSGTGLAGETSSVFRGEWLLGWPAALALLGAVGVVLLLVSLRVLDRVPIDHGWVLDTLVVLAVAALVAGLLDRSRRWWLTWGIATAVGAAGVVAAAAWLVWHTGLVDQHYPPSFLAWGWAAVWAALVALSGWWSGPVAARAVRLLAAPLVVLASFCLANAHYGYWPTLGALLGRPEQGQVSARLLRLEIRDARWARKSHSSVGVYGPLTIPGTSTGFDAATVYAWLPPDFEHVPHATLPVIMMLPGWPGRVQDWVRAGRAVETADHWAATHHGRAPVMVFVDENGAHGFDTECVNGPQGNVQSYLTTVVPTYLERNLGLRVAPDRWAVVGFSEGGTCAAGLGTEDPHLFGRFVDLAGDLAPNYGFHQPLRVTLERLYGGNVVAMREHDPLQLMASRRYGTTIGWFSAGRQDVRHLAMVERLAQAARASGMRTHLVVIPGDHSWTYAAQAFAHIYPALVRSLSPRAGMANGRLVTTAHHRGSHDRRRTVSEPTGRGFVSNRAQ